MNKILIAVNNETDVADVTSITVSDKKFVSIIYSSGRIVTYLYNPHFDTAAPGTSQRPFTDCPEDCENFPHCESTERCIERLENQY